MKSLKTGLKKPLAAVISAALLAVMLAACTNVPNIPDVSDTSSEASGADGESQPEAVLSAEEWMETLEERDYTGQKLVIATAAEGFVVPDDEEESGLIDAAAEKGLNTVVEYGEAAFYGPKLDFMVKDAIGRRWQLGTIQVDYNLPERFGLEYTGADNQKHRPIMIHRAPFGSMERFVAVLLEHTAGRLPLWLAPDQVVVLPISEKYNEYAKQVVKVLAEKDIRAFVDDRNEKIGKKIRDNELKRIPYLLVVGEKEAQNEEVSVRKQGEGDKGSQKITTFADDFAREIEKMTNF